MTNETFICYHTMDCALSIYFNMAHESTVQNVALFMNLGSDLKYQGVVFGGVLFLDILGLNPLLFLFT